jgi:thymidylate synthase (FAD)
MQFIKPNFEILYQSEGLEGIYKQIEIAGRTCYKSADKATENSAETFTQRMIDSGHGAMLEHGTIYLYTEYTSPTKDINYLQSRNLEVRYLKNKYSKVIIESKDNYKKEVYITTNYRVLVENDWLKDLQYMVEPMEHHEKRITVRFHMDRIGTQSCVRHRTMSFGQESTRYVNYAKDKFGNEINISIPEWTDETNVISAYNNKPYLFEIFCNFLNEKYDAKLDDDIKTNFINKPIFYWLAANEFAEWSYMKLIECGLRAEQARCILPVGIDSEIVITGSISDWNHFFDLRHFGTTGKPHPDIQVLATNLYHKFIELEYIEERK